MKSVTFLYNLLGVNSNRIGYVSDLPAREITAYVGKDFDNLQNLCDGRYIMNINCHCHLVTYQIYKVPKHHFKQKQNRE